MEVALGAGCADAQLVQRAADIRWELYDGIETLGLTAGASAPEVLVEEIVSAFGERFDVRVESVSTAKEDVVFKLPRELRDPHA